MPSLYAFTSKMQQNDKKTAFVESWIIIEMTSVSKNKVILEKTMHVYVEIIKWRSSKTRECDNRKKNEPEGKIIGIIIID